MTVGAYDRARRNAPPEVISMPDPARAATLADLLWPAREGLPRIARAAALVVVGSLLLWLSAKIKVPLFPVPVTMQTAVLFLIGIAYGPRLGMATALLYLAEGAIGLPVFAGTPERGIGLVYMVGPTGGYLMSFVAIAGITGWFAQRYRHWAMIALGILVAIIVNYTLGVAWLARFVGLETAITAGVLPFLLPDLVKLALATALAEAGLRTLRHRLAP